MVICVDCGEDKRLHAQGRCTSCYPKYWRQTAVRKKGKCPRCKRVMVIQAKGYCAGCYNYIFSGESTKKHTIKKLHGIDVETYDRITKKCAVCGFDKIVHLHHKDLNHSNISPGNLVGLCPNHHGMVHCAKYRDEINSLLEGL